jgi:hypothetical protein
MPYKNTGRPNGRPRKLRPGEEGYVPPVPIEKQDGQYFRASQTSVKALYEKYYASIEVDEDKPFIPAPLIVKKVLDHFKKHPFDKLKWGLLKIETKLDGLTYMTCNAEQRVLLAAIIEDWEANRPVRHIDLKARQVGITTFYQAATYCILSTQSYKGANCVADLIEKCEHQVEMFNTFHENEPEWVRPVKIKATKPLTLDDKAKGIRKNRVRFESAERRDSVGRSFTFQIGHFTEVPFWPPDVVDKVINSLKKCVPFGGGTAIFEESTGNNVGDVFYKRWHAAREGNLGGYRAFFFPVQMHEDYRKPLPRGMSDEEFIEGLSESDQERMKMEGVTVEFMNWYTSQRAEEMLENDVTELLFCREFPMTPEEAFLGANSNFFDIQRCKGDIGRTNRQDRQRPCRMDELPESSSFLVPTTEDGKIAFSRCVLETDWQRRYVNPRFIDAEDLTTVREAYWVLWERPRKGHDYILAADPSTGKLAIKNVKTSRDNAALGIWRITYDDREYKRFVQVGQLVAKGIGPKELAREAVAASLIYSANVSGPAKEPDCSGSQRTRRRVY